MEWLSMLFLVFFFQAEDGIRDTSVTGVQTCALPILIHSWLRGDRVRLGPAEGRLLRLKPPCCLIVRGQPVQVVACKQDRGGDHLLIVRSEERRVGKEGRCRWAADQWRETMEKICELR